MRSEGPVAWLHPNDGTDDAGDFLAVDVGREAHLHVLGPVLALGVEAKVTRFARVGLPLA